MLEAAAQRPHLALPRPCPAPAALECRQLALVAEYCYCALFQINVADNVCGGHLAEQRWYSAWARLMQGAWRR